MSLNTSRAQTHVGWLLLEGLLSARSVCEKPDALLVRLDDGTRSCWGLNGPREGCALPLATLYLGPLIHLSRSYILISAK